MPLYDYQCVECGGTFAEQRRVSERKGARCSCGGEVKILLSPTRSVLFKADWYNVSGVPKHCRTPQELKDECDRNGSTSHYLENSQVFRTSPGPDPEGLCGSDVLAAREAASNPHREVDG